MWQEAKMSQGARKAALSQEEESLSVEAQSLHDQLKVRTLSPHGRTHCSCIFGSMHVRLKASGQKHV